MTADGTARLRGDCERSIAWLDAMLARLAEPDAPAKSVLLTSLGASICDRVVASDGSRRLAHDAGARLNARLARGDAAAWRACDPLALAIGFALTPAETRTEPALAAARARCAAAQRDGEPATTRREVVARSLGTPPTAAGEAAHAGETAHAGEALCAHVLHGSAEAVSALCETIDAFGLHARSAEERRLAGAAIAARAFAAFRSSSGFELGTRLLRVLAGRGLDPIGAAEGLQVLRLQQRVDGSFGDLPPISTQAGDISFVFHLPRTVSSLWAIHDALAPVSLVRVAMAARAG